MTGPSQTRFERRRRIALIGHTTAGIQTQFRSVETAAASIPWLDPVVVPINPYRAGDMLERRFQFLSPATRGTLRSFVDAGRMFKLGGLDGAWTQVDVSLAPWLVTRNLLGSVPILYTCDSTPRLLRQLGPHYQVAVTRSVAKRALKDMYVRYFYNHVDLFNPWSSWVARSLREDYGVPDSRIAIMPPGIDVSFWHPPTDRDGAGDKRPVRLLFVGGDFERKGGDLLLDVYRHKLRGRVEIDLVTRTVLDDRDPGVRVHANLNANDERLVDLYRRADIFVLPTRADCFCMAALEAMASGLPVIICPVGGIRDILDHGRQGLFVAPDDGRALIEAILSLVGDWDRRRAMGQTARALAVTRYDATKNTSRLFERFLAPSQTELRSGRPASLDQS